MKTRWPLCVLLVPALCASAQAHRLDEYLQSGTLRVTPERIAVHLRMVPGVEVAQQVWATIDKDGSGTLSPAEQQAYIRQVLDDLSLSVDGQPLALDVVTWSFPTQADAAKGIGQISLGVEARLAGAAGSAGTHRLHFVTRHRPAPSVYQVNTLVPADTTVRIDGQRRSVDQAVYDLDFTQVDRPD